VLLPVVLLAGASVNVKLPAILLVLVAAALATKIIVRVLSGTLLSAALTPVRGVGLEFGASMLSSGALGLAVALSFSVRHPGHVSDAVLLLAALGVLLGEGLGPGALRRALSRAGEIKPDDVPPELSPPPGLERESRI
jgi:hypothetical protein